MYAGSTCHPFYRSGHAVAQAGKCRTRRTARSTPSARPSPILLAATRNDVVVKCTLCGFDTPLAARTYRTTAALTEDVRGALPSVEDCTTAVRQARDGPQRRANPPTPPAPRTPGDERPDPVPHDPPSPDIIPGGAYGTTDRRNHSDVQCSRRRFVYRGGRSPWLGR